MKNSPYSTISGHKENQKARNKEASFVLTMAAKGIRPRKRVFQWDSISINEGGPIKYPTLTIYWTRPFFFYLRIGRLSWVGK